MTPAPFETMRGAEAPVFVHAIKNCAGEKVISLAKRGGRVAEIIAQIKMPETPAPDFVGLKSDRVDRQPPLAVINVIPR